MAFSNKQKGLVPVTKPKHIIHYEVASGQTIYRHSAVTIALNKITAVATTPSASVTGGVALEYGTAGDKIPVCVDPFQLYSVLSDGGTKAQNEVITGLHIGGVTNAAGNANSLESTMQADYTSATATPGVTLYMKVVDVVDAVDGELAAATGVTRLLVKLLSLKQDSLTL